MSGLCELLKWDSDFFACRIGRVIANRMDERAVHSALDWCSREAIHCLYFLADPSDPCTIQAVEKHAFQLVDIRMSLETHSAPTTLLSPAPSAAARIRVVRLEDIPTLRAIARVSHQGSRFYHDLHFPRDRCDALYEIWIENSCRGQADLVLVADMDGQPSGYISAHLSHGTGHIGLLGVAAEAQGRGLGRQLLSNCLSWFNEHDITAVRVVTQGHNIKAIRLYHTQGFLTASVHLWYHRWFTQQNVPEETGRH